VDNCFELTVPFTTENVSRRLVSFRLDDRRAEIQELVRALVMYRELVILWDEDSAVAKSASGGTEALFWSKSTAFRLTKKRDV